MGVSNYRHKARNGKTHANKIFRLPLVAFRNRKLQLPSTTSELHEYEIKHYIDSGRRQIFHTPRFRFLDKAAIKESRRDGSKCFIGVAIQIIAAAVMYAVEILRMDVIRKKHITGADEVVPMSIFWLLPQHILLGLANTFLMAGLLEFFYVESPEEMKVLGTAFYTSTIAAGKYTNSLLVFIIHKFSRKLNGKRWIGNNLNDCHLDYYYGLIFVISAINFGVFVWVQRGYIYKKENTREVDDEIEILRPDQTEPQVGKA